MEVKHGSGLTPFYNTIINSTIDVCQFLNGTQSNVLLKWIIDSMTHSLPNNFFHPCPYVGRVVAYNASILTNTISSQFLKGRYKIFYRAFDEFDDNIISLKTETDMPRGND
jgi:Protein of unknown function (DUF1091)